MGGRAGRAAAAGTGAAGSGRGTGKGQGKGRSGPKGVAVAVTKQQHNSPGQQQGAAKRMQAGRRGHGLQHSSMISTSMYSSVRVFVDSSGVVFGGGPGCD